MSAQQEPDRATGIARAAGVALVQQRNAAGRNQQFPDYASYTRYLQGQNYLRSRPRPRTAPTPTPPIPVETQLLLNPNFTSIIDSFKAENWISTNDWQAWAYDGSSTFRPTAVISMPLRQDVYLTSDSSGFILFSYVQATVYQTVPVSLTGKNTITGILNIANTSNGSSTDRFTFKIEYKNIANTILQTDTLESILAPPKWTDYTLTRTRASTPDFDSIKFITVSITGRDLGNWGGQYGPAVDYCTLTVS